ncbi:hypothetical protein ABT158_49725 [Nonomuraea sp. NPDC001636]|uniref:hypothetical protein n=1 Tax=Nonomuraea sp. NPDC001636 TaxID=3154391 RepID=UPI003326AE82
MRVWGAVVAAAALLLAHAVPAQAGAAEDRPVVSVVPIGAQPPSFSGVCSPGVRFDTSATITADGPGRVIYRWGRGYGGWSELVFTEAGSKTVTGQVYHYTGVGTRSLPLFVQGANEVETAVTFTLGCVDPVPAEPQIQPALDYVGRCGADVMHTISAQISSPIAQTVRYRWRGYYDRPLPGGLGDEREIVFTEPGTKTVSAPFQRMPIPQTNAGNTIGVQILSPGATRGPEVYYRTTCVSAEFTTMTRTIGNCRTGIPYKYVMSGYVESSAIGEMSYAWARYDNLEGVWTRDPWKPMSFLDDNSPGRQNVSKTWTTDAGGSGVWRLEVLGTDGTVVSQSRPYSVPCV